jgi:hypothetical protein
VKAKVEAGRKTGNEFERSEDADIHLSSPLSRTYDSLQSHSSRKVQKAGWVLSMSAYLLNSGCAGEADADASHNTTNIIIYLPFPC